MISIKPTISDLKSIKVEEALVGLLIFMAVIPTGILTIYLYKPDLLISLGTAKLILFAISLTLPIYLLNLAIQMMFLAVNNQKLTRAEFTMAGFGSCISIYFAVGISYMYDFNFQNFILTILGMEMVIILLELPDLFKMKKQTQEVTDE
ncbi:MAG: hypothetical protein V3V05_10935 [Pontiella sp.]